MLGQLVLGHVVVHEGDQVLKREEGAGPRYDAGADMLDEIVVANADHRDVGYSRVFEQHFLEFSRPDDLDDYVVWHARPFAGDTGNLRVEPASISQLRSMRGTGVA